jgi:hypothetical protein
VGPRRVLEESGTQPRARSSSGSETRSPSISRRRISRAGTSSVKEWRKDHAFARFWTEFPDQMREARGFYMPVMEGKLSMKDVQNAPA